MGGGWGEGRGEKDLERRSKEEGRKEATAVGAVICVFGWGGGRRRRRVLTSEEEKWAGKICQNAKKYYVLTVRKRGEKLWRRKPILLIF